MARGFQLQDQVVNISSSFLEAGMAAENVGFRELKYWELMSRIGAQSSHNLTIRLDFGA